MVTASASSAEKSTIVRAEYAGASWRYGASRRHRASWRYGALALAERYAPGLGAWLAVRMWMTLPAGAPAAARPRLAEPGERGTVRTDGPRPARIATESWGRGPVVYLLHGWGGYRGQLGAFVGPLTAAGFRVVALDAPGHGESGPGRLGPGRGLLPEFSAALGAAVGRFGPGRGVIAHSMGAAATAVAALDGLDVQRLVLIAPVTDPVSAIGIWTRMAGVGARIRARMPRRIERRARISLADFDIVARAAEREDLPSALVIHDGADKEVPFGLGARVAGAWPDARLEGTHGLGHRRILRDTAVIRSAVAFLAGA
jgi:pimeloyl-ACP methyl ester carboxylesterase